MSSSISTAGAGLTFGMALTASGVYLPSVIVSQLEMKDYHMLKAFLSASAVSAIVMAAFERFNIAQRQPRKASSVGWLGPYDANIFGGLGIGVGMALTGACPGTVLVQMATGINSGFPTALGGLLGGILYAKFGGALQRGQSPPDPQSRTIQAKFDMNQDQVLLMYEIMCSGMIGISTIFGPDRSASLLHPVAGGVLIGGAQAASLLLTGNAIGVSGAYEEAGRYFWYFIAPGKKAGRPATKAMTFALGILIGSIMLSQTMSTAAQSASISSLTAILGGCTMIFGARLAGGCTSGHGISGMSTFSISSIVTVMAMFGGGILTAKLLA